jgi:hypothetical protein
MSKFKVKFENGHEIIEIQSKRAKNIKDYIPAIIRLLERDENTYYDLQSWVHDFVFEYNNMMERKSKKIEEQQKTYDPDDLVYGGPYK